ncbi:MAG: tRNA pseudouridine(55) synthase TruB [Actinomycetes bacterium]
MSRGRSDADGPTGVVVVDKASGWTSHDVVARLRRLAGTRKVGHAGTLDPMATGVLVCGLGRATRLLTYLVGADKTYTATIRLGAGTVTDDAEGEVTRRSDAAHVTREDVVRAVDVLTGEILQGPSAVSAVKVEGRRSYARVRSGEQVALAARPVTVHRFAVLDARHRVDEGSTVLDVDVEVSCSSGTYVRALARDLGDELGVGGHLTVLRRTAVGPFGIEAARTLDELAEALVVVPLAQAAAAALPVRTLDAREATSLGHGQRLAPVGLSGPAAAIGPDGELVAVLEERDGVARPVIVLKPA